MSKVEVVIDLCDNSRYDEMIKENMVNVSVYKDKKKIDTFSVCLKWFISNNLHSPRIKDEVVYRRLAQNRAQLN